MKKLSSLWMRLKNTIYEKYGQESGKMLLHAGVITWVTACLSQVVAVAINDKIPKEQKKFLVPQEIADGVLNVIAFYFITNSVKNVAGKLVSTGKWSTQAIRNFVSKNDPAANLFKRIFSKNNTKIIMGDISTDLGKTFKENDEFHKCYDKFKGGMDMFSSVVGAVISSNIVTPVIRNSIGAKQQKQSLERDKKQQISKSYSQSAVIYPKQGNLKI